MYLRKDLSSIKNNYISMILLIYLHRGQKGIADEKGIVVIYIYAKIIIDTKKKIYTTYLNNYNIYNNE